jgi:hypothetical protein
MYMHICVNIIVCVMDMYIYLYISTSIEIYIDIWVGCRRIGWVECGRVGCGVECGGDGAVWWCGVRWG